MSHSVTITRTTTTTSGSGGGFIVNSGYIKTLPGLLKLAQLIINAICVGLVAYYFRRYHSVYSNGNPELFFLLMTTAFLIGTFCLLLSCLVSWSTGGIISKTIYVSYNLVWWQSWMSQWFLGLFLQELIYHSVAFLLLLIASIIFLVEVSNNKYGYNVKEAYYAASVRDNVGSSVGGFNIEDILFSFQILGLVNAGLYLLSAFLANKTYRGL